MAVANSKKQFSQNRKLFLLIILVTLTIFVWIFQGDAPVEEKAAKSNRELARKNSTPIGGSHLLAKQLNLQQPSFDQEKRNLFSFYQPPQPAEPPPVALAEMQAVCGNQMCEGGEDHQNCPTDCQPPPPPIPPITLRYIGYMAEKSGRMVFLTDGREVYVGRLNDIIANKYRVLKITEESVELGYLNMNESRTIPFQGSQGG